MAELLNIFKKSCLALKVVLTTYNDNNNYK